MNAVEIEEAVSELAAAPFDASEFPFAFLTAFGNKAVTVQRLRAGSGNASDVAGGVLQRNNIHMAVCAEGQVAGTLNALRASPKTAANKVKFILATDGVVLEAEELATGDPLACAYPALADHFGFFLPLAGISTVRQIKDNPVDIKATGRLNKLYVELLKDNPDWAGAERRPELNHLMARLIFCMFAEDTGIFPSKLFSKTVEQMSDGDNTHEILAELFRAMATHGDRRAAAGIKSWADRFPYVNGGLFADAGECPRFSKIARTYLLRAASLNWQEINPDIFGSMIQAVADDEERGALGMHYTSVPNILKVLNPLFLDDLTAQLEEAGDNGRSLLNLRKRMAKIRVFDPACGSGNFLVIAYKEMRRIEAEINRRRGEPDRRSDIPLTNYRGIELRDFPAEIARLALIIAEYQSDVVYRGQREALADFLPLDAQNWITCDNALRLDWLSVCPPTGAAVKLRGDDLFSTPLDQAEIDFENEGGETYICGNPPYRGSQQQTAEQKGDLEKAFTTLSDNTSILDYVSGWFAKAAKYIASNAGRAAFVTTNSINQGRQVEALWPPIFGIGVRIYFAHTSFLWANLASNNAGVTVSIVGLDNRSSGTCYLFSAESGALTSKAADNINGYLIAGPNIEVSATRRALSGLPEMLFGNMPNDGGELLLSKAEALDAWREGVPSKFIRPFVGSHEFINGLEKFCIWVLAHEYEEARRFVWLNGRFERVRLGRLESNRAATKDLAAKPFAFGEIRQTGNERALVMPRITSERRDYLPAGVMQSGSIVSSQNFALYDAPIHILSILTSKIHRVWIGTVCGRTRTDFAYSNTLGWNTFPVPTLTEKNKADLTRCAEDILLTREAHYPATIADLYDPETMPDDLRRAHERNDETLERIYIGRTFRNDTERLEKLFELYTRMTTEIPRRKGAA
ncbi:class I SAM-dependent DNA methyltransferase [Brevundimonas subvibrioides]|uniref:class I SAM-dependent DNA methyltransferase n=1 Tax=Brevundimonas subvibrioides TaxID=74313 RepID=UPI0022B37133|nr:DNA methyltransferase [Brevundimonas subvibrioides]